MIEKITVITQVHTSLVKHKADVLLQLLTVFKIKAEPVHKLFFFRGQCIGILRHNGWEGGIQEWIGFAVDGDGSIIIIDLIQKISLLHLELRMFFDDLSFQLKLKDCDGFVHLGIEFKLIFRHLHHGLATEDLTRIILIGVQGKGG